MPFVLLCVLIIASACGNLDDQAGADGPLTNSANPPIPTTEITPTPPDAPQQMTISEYALWCAEMEQGLNPTEITWGAFNTILIETEEAYTSASPPNSLSDYHNHRASIITVMRSVAEEKDESLLVTLEDLLDPRIMAIALLAPPTIELPSDVRQQLLASGCISESSSTDTRGLISSDRPKEIRRIGVGEAFEGNVEGVAITVDGFAWEEEIRTSEYSFFEPDDGSRFLVVTFTIHNRSNQDLMPDLVRNSFYVEDAAGVQNYGTSLIGIEDVSDEEWGVIMADIVRAGRTARTLKTYEIKNRASELVVRSDDLGVFVGVPERPQ